MKIKDSSDINFYKDNETKFNNYKTSGKFFLPKFIKKLIILLKV